MNREARRKAAKDLSLRLQKLKGYARRGSARAAALLVLAKKTWVDGDAAAADLEAFEKEFGTAPGAIR